jgi:hypothetical protein
MVWALKLRQEAVILKDSSKICRNEWLAEKTSFWTAAIGELASTARLYPQSAYMGLQSLLQQEWQYVQHAVGDISGSFSEVESAIQNEFVPALFGDGQEADNSFRMLLGLPVKQVGVVLPNPTESGQANYKAGILVCSHLPPTGRLSRPC